MYKLTLSLLMMLCLVTGASAQGASGMAKKGANALKKNPGKGPAGMSIKPPKTPKAPKAPGKLDKALDVTVTNAEKAATATPKVAAQNAAVNAAKKPPRPAPQKQASDMAQVSATARELTLAKVQRAARKRNLLDKQEQDTEFNAGIGKSVLFIPNVALEKDPSILVENPHAIRGFSMTVIRSPYKGKDEIFGVIPTHSLPSNFENADAKFGVTKKFKAELLLPNGNVKTITAEVVQISPRSMLDVSLVKFNAQDEPFLRPLELSDAATELKEPLFLYGRANGVSNSFDREVTKNSFISARINMISPANGERQGFCGSPWLNAEGKVKAIHTGSVEGERVSHGTHASFVKKLIEAYHNGGKAEYNLMLDGNVLTTLNVDEYISAFAIADSNLNIIYKEDGVGVGGWKPNGEEVYVLGKYSESRVRKAMQMPGAEYLILHSRTPFWETDMVKEPMLVEDRSISTFDDSKLREHVYHLADHELSWVTEANESGWDSLLLKQLDGMPVKK